MDISYRHYGELQKTDIKDPYYIIKLLKTTLQKVDQTLTWGGDVWYIEEGHRKHL